MASIILHIEAQKDMKFIERLAQNMNIRYEKLKNKSSYKPKFVAKIRESEEQIKNGEFTSIQNQDELNKFL